MTVADIAPSLLRCAEAVEHLLDAHLAALAAPERLLAAMRHGALAGGKKLRPFMLQQAAALFGVSLEASLRAGAAVELLHAYSLVHDDLPDMDNDTLRRGRPTVWAAFDPATAILAGDALQTEAFALLASPATHASASIRSELVATLALAAGGAGMVGGQVLDIEGETTALDEDAIFAMQARKTGALIRASAEMGAILGGAADDDRAALILYGISAGLAFQIADDILDVTTSSDTLGKTAGKDIVQNKSTIVARRGVAGAREILDVAVAQGRYALERFGTRGRTLEQLLVFIAEREH